MSNKKNTVEAAKAAIKKDRTSGKPDQTQGSLADRHVRHHTPERLYGPKDGGTT